MAINKVLSQNRLTFVMTDNISCNLKQANAVYTFYSALKFIKKI